MHSKTSTHSSERWWEQKDDRTLLYSELFLHRNAQAPRIVTDCLSILRTLERGLAWATDGARP